MKIINVVCAQGRSGFYFDDQMAIKKGAITDGNNYEGTPVTPGFTAVRQAGESISVMLILDDGQMALGSCAAVQYSGAGGRDPLFLAKEYMPVIEKTVKPALIGLEITDFKSMAEKFDAMTDENGKKLHTAIRYGVTQALLDACAKASKTIMANVIARDYHTTVSSKMIPIFTQSGDDRYLNVDKMIIKGADALPHGLFNNLDKIGQKGELLADYTKWCKERIEKLRINSAYKPILHMDVYGTLGLAFNNDFEKIADFMGELEKLASPFQIRVEGPVDMGGREAQIEALATIRQKTDAKGINVEIVADEWCNTYEDVVLFTDNKAGHMAQIKTPDLGGINNIADAVLYCKKNHFGAYVGGTCNETDISSKACVNIVMATSPALCLAKPGMGVDEGYFLVYNEMQRILALKDIM